MSVLQDSWNIYANTNLEHLSNQIIYPDNGSIEYQHQNIHSMVTAYSSLFPGRDKWCTPNIITTELFAHLSNFSININLISYTPISSIKD